MVAGTADGRNRLADTFAGAHAYNEPKVRQASHVVVLCARQAISDDYLQHVPEREQADGRFASDEARAGQHRGR